MRVIRVYFINQLCVLQGRSMELFLLSFNLDVYRGRKLKAVR